MARPGLFTHRKLPRLARLANVRIAEALGILEFLWHAQYEACSEVVGDAIDVETLARWEGESGKLTAALVDAGFLDALEDGTFAVHDFWDHAPDYVRKRAEREVDRKKRGVTLSEIRAENGRRGARVTNAGRSQSGKRPANGRIVADHETATERQIAVTPAPAPAPAPAPQRENPTLALLPEVSTAPASPRSTPERGKGGRPDEETWVEYARETWPAWPEPDIRGAWAYYQARGWKGISDWKAAAKTCAHRSAGRPMNAGRRAIAQPSFQNEGLVGPAKYADVPVKEV